MAYSANVIADRLAEQPLVIDLDGTLIKSDLLIESFMSCVTSSPTAAIQAAGALRSGKAQTKSVISAAVNVDPATLPYDPNVLALINAAIADGRSVYLASASDEKYVRAIADHLGLFEGWFASNGSNNLSGSNKAAVLKHNFGQNGFDYVGNDKADLDVWRSANRKLAVRPSSYVRRKLLALDPNAEILDQEASTWRDWMRMLRVHQYSKNALVFVPIFTAHRFDQPAIVASLVAFLAFCLCASAVYILNDIVDLGADRKHPTKKNRPLAAGKIALDKALYAVPLLLVSSFALAASISPPLVAALAAYLALTVSYSVYLKRKMFIDVVVLALLYTTRIVAGAAAIGVAVSEWLLAFSMFLFVALALVKRYTEIIDCINSRRPDPTNRNYRSGDLNVIGSLAAASGFNAMTVFALFISSESVQKTYQHSERLWLICPILIYWMGRTLIMASRGLMNDDPVVFAMKDRNSLAAGALILIIAFAAKI